MTRLILLSDLWGASKSNWLKEYEKLLIDNFDLQWYDCRQLGQVSIQETDEAALHQHFINGGIDKAVSELLKKETSPIDILGFSLGGTIGWKAALAGLQVRHLFAVSSTRLRYETQKPPANIQLYFGSNDAYRPAADWCSQMNISCNIFDNETHLLYANPEIARQICCQVKNTAPYPR